MPPRPRLRVLGPAAVILSALTPFHAAGAEPLPALEVVESEGVSVALPEPGASAAALVTVVNPGDTAAQLSVRLLPEGPLAKAVDVTIGSTSVAAGEAASVRLNFTLRQAMSATAGSVVIGAAGFAPVAVPLTIDTGDPLDPWPILLFAAVVAGAFLWLRLRRLRGRYDPNGELGSVKWDFSGSWATNLTTVGAILGTVIAAGVLPAEGQLFGAKAVAGLSVFFGVLAILSGLVYSVASRWVVAEGEPARQGYVRPFLVAAGITVAAVVGELTTLGVLLVDAAMQGSVVTIAIALLVLLALAALLVLRHAWVTIGWTLTHLVKPRPRAKRGAPAPPAEGWSLL